MHEYDTALKSVIRRLSGSALLALTGFAIQRWHNVELPEVRSPRADMIGESAAGGIVHVEPQSTNDADMALRMAECALALYRRFGLFPQRWSFRWEERPSACRRASPARREVAVRELIILAGLRSLGAITEEETKKMPLLDDIMDHDLLGPAIRRGQRSVVVRQIEKRFGVVPGVGTAKSRSRDRS